MSPGRGARRRSRGEEEGEEKPASEKDREDAQEVPQRIQELLSALCADGGRLRHQHTRNMVRRLLQYVGLDALVLAVVYLVRFLQLTKLAPSDRIDTLYLAAVILGDKFSNDDNFCDLASTICLLWTRRRSAWPSSRTS